MKKIVLWFFLLLVASVSAGKIRGEKTTADQSNIPRTLHARGRSVVKVGANKDPKETPRNGSDSCEEASVDGKKVFNGGELNKICLGGIADICTYFYGYTEYECECFADNPYCEDPSILTEENACLDGYVLRRNNLQGALFWTCDVV